MNRAVAHYLPREMALLGLVEGLLSFAAICLICATASRPEGLLSVSPGLPTKQIGLALCLTAAVSSVALAIGLYRPDVCLDRKRLVAAGLATFAALAVLLLLSCAATTSLNEDALVLTAELLAGWALAIAAVRLVHGLAIRRRPLARRILLVGDGEALRTFQNRLSDRAVRQFEPVILPEQDVSWKLLRLRRVWAVVLVSDTTDGVREALLDCKMRGMRVLTTAALQEGYLGRMDLDTLTIDGLLTGPGFSARWPSTAVKRLSDLMLGTVLLIMMLPLMAITAVAVKLDSQGPVLYRQQRTGQFGRPFTLLKFRSMAVDAEAAGNPRWAQKHDPRVTRVGRFIRMTRIDELPQLANVICGEMSLVGPRPERPHFVAQLTRAIPFYDQRSYVRPGLTGWAQVNFPYGASVEDAREKLSYDLYYVKNRSLMMDMAILLATVRVVLKGEGAH